jgi:hypothetical protein
VEYSYRYREQYPEGVFWLNAANDLRNEFGKLGQFLLGASEWNSNQRLIHIYELLRDLFSESELRELCFELGVDPEIFSRYLGKPELAREIVSYFERHGRLNHLEEAIYHRRPNAQLDGGMSSSLFFSRPLDELIALAFAHLGDHAAVLLVFDNLGDPKMLDGVILHNLTPASLPCRLLFTTRQRDLAGFRPVGMTTLPEGAALDLLLRHESRKPARRPDHPEHQTARAICATLGYLPLALEIASAHLGKFPAPLAKYHEEIKRRGAIGVLEHVSVQTRHEAAVRATLLSQWEPLSDEVQMLLRVAGQLPEAAYLPAARLGLLAGIPEEGEGFFDLTLTQVLDELEKGSLIEELRGEEVRLHPLVREFAKQQTPVAEKDAFRRECVRRLLDGLTTIAILEAQCDWRGIDALLEDLLVAQAWLMDERERAAATPGLDTRLGNLLYLLRREAHHLRGWRLSDAPGFLAQQLLNRQRVAGLNTVFRALTGHLQKRVVPFWPLRWSARRESTQLEQMLTGHEGGVLAVAVTADGRRVVSGSEDRTVRVWNLATRKKIARVAVDGAVSCVAVTAGDSENRVIVFIGDAAGNVYCFDYVEPGDGVGSGEWLVTSG